MREKPLDQAARAFAWAMREVRLRPMEGEASPPVFVLQRSWAQPWKLALVFLALLEQIGDSRTSQSELLGFLLQIPAAREGKKGERPSSLGVRRRGRQR